VMCSPLDRIHAENVAPGASAAEYRGAAGSCQAGNAAPRRPRLRSGGRRPMSGSVAARVRHLSGELGPPMDLIVSSLIQVILIAINIYIWLIIASAVLSWLVAFNVVNTSNRVVYMIGDFLFRVTEPALRPIRRVLPDLGPVDISPIVLLLALFFLQSVLGGLLVRGF
jgi:YggT family protein